jgi:hypothetical protein
MAERDVIRDAEARCMEILNSPYLRQQPPGELQKLRALLVKVDTLTRENVPMLVAEIKRLRNEIKRLEADAEAARQRSQNGADVNSADVNSADVNSADVNSADVNSADVNSADVNSADVNSAVEH